MSESSEPGDMGENLHRIRQGGSFTSLKSLKELLDKMEAQVDMLSFIVQPKEGKQPI